MIQNKFYFAITGNTAVEIIYQKADYTKENIGITTWKNSQDGRILKSDVMIAKNYLEEKQMKRLGKAENEYNEFNKTQKITSDFDKLLIEVKK